MTAPRKTIWQVIWRMKFAVAIILVMRIYLMVSAMQSHSYLTDDSIQYLTIADNMAAHGVFSQSYAAPFTLDAQRTPGYPVLLYVLSSNPLLIIILQNIFGLLSGMLIYQIVQDQYGGKWAATACFFYLLQPYGAIFCNYILSETLFIFLLLAWLRHYHLFWNGLGWRRLLGSIVFLCLAVLVRPVALPLLVVVAGAALVKAYQLRRRVGLNWLVVALVPIFVLGPWMARNERITGAAALSTMGPMGMLHGRLGGLSSYMVDGRDDEQALYMHGDSILGLEIGLPNIRQYPADKQTHETEQIVSGMTGKTIGYFWQHPIAAIGFQLHAFWNMLKGSGWGWSKALTHNVWAAYLLAGFQLLLNVLMYLGGLLAVLRRRNWNSLTRIAFWSIAIVLLVSAAAWADGRYRMVIDPLFVLLLTYALWNYDQRMADLRAQKSRSANNPDDSLAAFEG